MALNPRTRGPRRTLAALMVAMIVLFGGIAAAATWASAQWTPKLGLDLEGGTEMTLEPVLADPTQQVNQGQLEKARDTVDSPEASGEAIAREFERYLRRGDGPNRDDSPPWRPGS